MAAINLTFYLKHFQPEVITKVLSDTGYTNLCEYETLCRRTDMFTVSIGTDGLMTSVFPKVDTTKYRVYEFSIHHLSFVVSDALRRDYIGMDLTAYELLYPTYNNIYVVIPYRVSHAYEQCPYENTYCDLTGWTYRRNRHTKNSYVVRPPTNWGKVTKTYNNMVYFKSGPPMMTILATESSGFSSPMYYTMKYKGWTASLSLLSELIASGATKRTSSSKTPKTIYPKVKIERVYDEVIIISSDDE